MSATASGKLQYYCVQYVGKLQGDLYRRSVSIRQKQPPTQWRAFEAARDDFQEFAFGGGAVSIVKVEAINVGACNATSDASFVCGSTPSTPAGLVWGDIIAGVQTFSAAGSSGSFDMNNAPGGGNSAFDAFTEICNPTASATLRFTFNVQWDAALSGTIQIVKEAPGAAILFSRTGSFAGGSDVIVHDIPLTPFGTTNIHFEFNQTATAAEMNGTFTCALV